MPGIAGRRPGAQTPGGRCAAGSLVPRDDYPWPVVSHATRLRLRVAPGAPAPAVVGRHGDFWKVRVAAAPERGKANEAVSSPLADTLAVPRASVTLVSGGGSRNKIVELTGIEPDQIERRLATAGGQETHTG